MLLTAVAPAVAVSELRPEHWPAVTRIYAEGISTGDATFETAVPGWQQWDASHLQAHRFVALRPDEVVAGPR